MSNGPRFFETRMGMRFFEVEVPRIIKVLERIATALEARSTVEVIPLSTGRPTSGPLTAADRCTWCENVRAGDSHLCGACLTARANGPVR